MNVAAERKITSRGFSNRVTRNGTRGEHLMFSLGRTALLIVWLLVVMIPLYMLITVALKSPKELTNNLFGLPQLPIWENFTNAFRRSNFGQALFNSVIVTATAVAALVLLGASAAYPLARRGTRESRGLYLFFLAGIMVPFQLAMLPLYKLMLALNLVNSPLGVICIYTATSLPFTIFLYVGFIKGINRELEEAAMIDGCGKFQMFWVIVFPLLAPVTATVVIVNSIFIWNDLLVALLFLQKREARTIPIATFSFVGQYNSDWTAIFASVVLSILPMIFMFLLLQRYFIKGLSSGAIKG